MWLAREPLFYVALLIMKLKWLTINSLYRAKWWLEDSFKLCMSSRANWRYKRYLQSESQPELDSSHKGRNWSVVNEYYLPAPEKVKQNQSVWGCGLCYDPARGSLMWGLRVKAEVRKMWQENSWPQKDKNQPSRSPAKGRWERKYSRLPTGPSRFLEDVPSA